MTGQEAAQEAIMIRNAVSFYCLHHSAEMAKNAAFGVTVPSDSTMRHFGKLLARAKVLIWTKDIFDASRRGYEVFRDAEKLEELKRTINEPVFWHNANFYHVFSASEAQKLALPTTHEFDVGQYLIFRDGEDLIRMIIIGLPGSSIPILRFHKIDPIIDRYDSALLLAQLAFLQIKLPGISIDRVEPSRPFRRRAQRENEALPECRIIQLRHRETVSSGLESSRTYHHSWIRSGGWVRLHEPLKHDSKISGGKQGDSIIWRRAAVCGNGPLLEPRESVYVVAR